MKSRRVFAEVSALLAVCVLLAGCSAVREAKQEQRTDAPEDSAAQTQVSLLFGGEIRQAALTVGTQKALLHDGEELLAELVYPTTLENAAEAELSLDTTDLDGDGYGDPTLFFTFPDGSGASLLWLHGEDGYQFNEEFSVLQGEPTARGGDA